MTDQPTKLEPQKVITTRLTTKQHRGLTALARQCGMSVNVLVVNLIEQAVGKNVHARYAMDNGFSKPTAVPNIDVPSKPSCDQDDHQHTDYVG